MPPKKNIKVEMKKDGRNINGKFVPNADPNIGTAPMTPDDLKGNESPFKIPAPKDGTAAPSLEGAINGEIDAFTANLEQKRKDSEQKKEASLQALLKGKLDMLGEEEGTAAAYAQDGGVDDIEQELNQANQDILVEKNALNALREKFETKGGGLESGMNSELYNAERQSLRRQADLTVIQMGVQGRYDSAKAIADRAVAVQLEKDKTTIDVLQTIYTDNKDQFTQDEQRAFETKQKDRERKFAAEEQKLKDIYSLGLDYLKEGGDSATAQEIFNSKSVAEAASKTGNVLGATARLQRQKLVEDIRKLTTPVNNNILTGKDKFDAQTGLAKAFNDRTGDYRKASGQISTIRTLASDAVTRANNGESIAAASQGVITAFNKLLDPTSVVRESEYARSAEGLALISRVEGQYSRLTQGGAGITADDLQEFSETAETLIRGYENTAIDEAQLIIEQAVPAGLEVRQIVPSSVLDLMENRFTEALDSAQVGETFTVAGQTYKKVDADNFEPI